MYCFYVDVCVIQIQSGIQCMAKINSTHEVLAYIFLYIIALMLRECKTCLMLTYMQIFVYLNHIMIEESV